jgi:hydrogenase small subunit
MPHPSLTVPFDVTRRDFLKVCSAAAAAIGLPAWAGEEMADQVASGNKPSVIWLHFQECTGCTESLLRTSHPDVGALVLDLVSLDYHETLFAAAGDQFEAALEQAMAAGDGKYVCVVEGSVPTFQDGAYCQVGGRTALELCRTVGARAGAVIAIGSCASWGGIASAAPNPTGARGVPDVLQGNRVVTLPGCPANPYTLLGTILQYATFGTLPALDARGRPKLAYARVIHEDCPRRPHFDAGRFAQAFGDEGHRQGFCLYKLGCKGPQTHASCALQPFCDVPGAWPIGIGHPCIGCTEPEIAFRVPLHTTVTVDRPTAPMAYPGIGTPRGEVSAVAAGVAGVTVGAIAAGGFVASRQLAARDDEQRDGEEDAP